MSFLESDPTYRDPDDALRDLLERQHLILDMEATPGWELWRDFLAAEQEGYQNRLLKGRHKELVDYKFDAGFCEGIRFALGVSDTLSSRVSAMRANLEPSRLPEDGEPLADMEDNLA